MAQAVLDPVAEQLGLVPADQSPDPIAASLGLTPVPTSGVRPPIRQAELVAQTPATITEPRTSTVTDLLPTEEQRAQGRAKLLDLVNPIPGIKQAVGAAAKLGQIQQNVEQDPTKGISATETAGDAHEFLAGVFGAMKPIIAAGVVAEPAATALALLQAGVAAKATTVAASYVTDKPEFQALAGDLAAVLSGTFSTHAFLEKNLGDVTEVLRQAKAFDKAHPEPATPAGPTSAGGGATEAARARQPRLEPENVSGAPSASTPVHVAPDPVAEELGLVPAPKATQMAGAPAEFHAVEPDAVASELGLQPVPTSGAKFSSTQVQLPPRTAKKLTALAASIPDADLAEHGREDDPHVTVKYGIHTTDVSAVKAALADEPPVRVTLGKTSLFPDRGNGEVLKADVDSPDLHRLNAKIAGAVETTDTHPDYAPHATIAYLKPGTGQQYVGRTDLEGETTTIDRVTFSTPDGQKVEIPLTGTAVERKIGASDVQKQGQPLSRGVGTVPAGRPDPSGGAPAGPSPADLKIRQRALKAERRAKHQAIRDEYAAAVAAAPKEVFDRLIAQAHADGYEGEDAPLHAELANRLAFLEEGEQEFKASGHDPQAILKAVAKYGGLSVEAESAQKRELLDLAQAGTASSSGKHPPFGMVGGVQGVINLKKGLSLDGMLEAFGQDPEFSHITSLEDLKTAIEDAATAKAPVGLPVDRLEKHINPDWWKRLSPPPDEQDFDADLADIRAEDAGDDFLDESGNPKFAKRDVRTPSMFDEAAGGDVLDTGEIQPRLPGAEQVRDREVATPEFEAPFSLTSETEKRKGTTRPLFSKREAPAPVFYSALTRAAEDLPQAKGTPEQMAAMLQKAKGVKKEELDWSGVVEWLQGQQRFVTKSDIVDYLKANELQVTETVLGGEQPDDMKIRGEQFALANDIDEARAKAFGPGTQGNEPGQIPPQVIGNVARWVANQFGDDVTAAMAARKGLAALNLTPERRQALDAYGRLAHQSHVLNEKRLALQKPTKFSQHTLPGGEQYRELLITLPPRGPLSTGLEARKAVFTEWQPQIDAVDEEIDALLHDGSGEGRGAKLALAQEKRQDLEAKRDRDADAAYKLPADDPQFRGGHFEEPNVLAHLRFDDRTDSEGKSVLFIEEVQSDWMQQARKKGMVTEKPYEVFDPKVGTPLAAFDTEAEAQAFIEKRPDAKALDYSTPETMKAEGRVPRAPFKTTWPELAMKRAIRYAAEHGYDKLAWTTGEQQNERYDLSKHVDAIRYRKHADGTFTLNVIKNQTSIDVGTNLSRLKPDEIANVVGKDVAERIVNGEGVEREEDFRGDLRERGRAIRAVQGRHGWDIEYEGGQTMGIWPSKASAEAAMKQQAEVLAESQERELSGVNLKVGGSGMKGFYDQILPAFLNKFGKPFGAKVEDLRFPVGSGQAEHWETVHAISISPEMRETAMQGLPLFAKGDPLSFVGRDIPENLRVQAGEQWALLKSTYDGIAATPKADLAVLDAGGRLTTNELTHITGDKDFQALSDEMLAVLHDVIVQMLGESAQHIERTGIVLDDRTYGVFLPKPGTAGGQRKAIILLNPFEHMIGGATPKEAAAKTYTTAVHEALHWDIARDGPTFDAELLKRLQALGASFEKSATARMMRFYADPTDQSQYRRGLRDLLSRYRASRQRPERTPDSVSAAGRGPTRPATQPTAARPPPGDVRRSQRKTVTLAELRRLAKARGTSLDAEYARARKAGYEVEKPQPELVGPKVQQIAAGVRKDRGLILSVLAPARIGVAPVAAGIIRAHTAANDQRKARVDKTLRAVKQQMDRWSEAQSLAFTDVMEGYASIDTLSPEWKPVAQVFRETLNHWRDLVLEKGLLRTYIEQYWPHEWQKRSIEGEAIRKWFGRRPMQGPEAFRKHRSIPSIREGIKFGLTPLSYNPAEQLQRKIFEMSQSVKGRDIHDDLIKHGLYSYVPVGKPKPDVLRHWQRVPDYALGVKYAPPSPENRGLTVLGHYYAPPEVVRLVENHLSPGLWGRSAIYDLYKSAGNVSTQFLLGWSTFHLWLTGLESVISKAGTVVELTSRGELKEAAKLAAHVGPQGVVLDLLKGYRAVQAFYRDDADANDTTGIIGQIVNAGGGFGWSLFEHEGAPERFMTNLRQLTGALGRMELGSAAMKLPKTVGAGALAAWELPTSLIMNRWVPYLKVSAFLDMVEMENRRLGPDATLAEQRKVWGDVWDAVDDRFGQLRYDNLFWNNTFKQLLTGGFLSVGWQVGSIRHGLGALGQVTRLKENLAARGGGKGPPGVPKRTPWFTPEGEPGPEEPVMQPGVQRNAAWIFSGAIIVGLMGALWQYLHTGKPPESVKDLYYPRNGRIGPSGREERDTPISYAKDYYAWTHHPVTTLGHKLKPILSQLWDLVENEDFFGNEIRNENDPVVTQFADVLRYALKRQAPIAWANAIQRAGSGASVIDQLKAWALIQVTPFTPAPAELERSDAENYLHSLMPPVHRTKEEAEKADARFALREGIRSGTKAEALQTAREAGLSAASRRSILRSERQGALKSAFERATWTQAAKAYELATPEERTSLKPMLSGKFGRARASAGSAEARQTMTAKRNALMALPTAR